MNFIGAVGRGKKAPKPEPRVLAQAQFSCNFWASQNGFSAYDKTLMTALILFYLRNIKGAAGPVRPVAQECKAGERQVFIDKDYAIKPCSFFSDAIGPMTSLENEVDCALNTEFWRKQQANKQYYEAHCKKCRAFSVCDKFCSLAPTDDIEEIGYYCECQRASFDIMNSNKPLVEHIVTRFLMYKSNNPDEGPTTCGFPD